MGINADFFLKHVRPASMDAYQDVCNARGAGSLYQYLVGIGVDPQTIAAAFNTWAVLALRDIHDPANLPLFAAAAREISQARWNELYQTDASTILFMDQPLIRELSYQSEHNAGGDFEFDPAEVIPLAITIQRVGNAVQVQRDVAGAHLAADAQGNACHFAGLM